MPYNEAEFVRDAENVATLWHLVYTRCRFLAARWQAGISAEIPRDANMHEGYSGTQIGLLVEQAGVLVANMEQYGNSTLNIVEALSSLTLPTP